MAAQIRSTPQQRKPTLIGRIEDENMDTVVMAVITPGEDGVITVSEDRSIRIWLKRESGQFWPSVCHFLTSPCSTMFFNSDRNKHLFIGLTSGVIEEFRVADDYNAIYHQRKYLAHQRMVTGVKFDPKKEVIVSCGKDKYVTWHLAQNGQRLGGYATPSIPLCLQYDEESNYVFAGLTNGEIAVLKIDKNNCQLVTSLKGHSGAVHSMAWDAGKQILYSGSADKVVIVWDIGSKVGRAIELQGHNCKVVSVNYCLSTRQLVSIDDRGSMVIWDMDIKRLETPLWQEKDQCQKCEQPFFWNFRQMWQDKTVGLRQHHCRKCGQAMCAKCTSHRTTIPLMGFEYEVRVCEECHASVSEEEKAPTATFHDLKQGVIAAAPEWKRSLMVTSGNDRAIKLWDLKQVIFK